MPNCHLLTFSGTRAGFTRAFADLRRTLDAHTLPERARYNCELVFEEVVTNVIRHGYNDDREHRIDIALELLDDAIVIRFEDDGIPFDPRKYEPITHSNPTEDAPIGGRGLLLVRTAARQLEYERTNDRKNRFTVTIAATD
jgi:serine/threonine-protein kinase RsbW